MTDLPGLDLEAIARWMDAELPGLRRGPLDGSLIAGGLSNLTYRVEDGVSVWALRRPPVGHVLPTAHDMAREHRVLRALAGTPVPVPQPLALCEDVDVTGAPFYLMSYVEGLVLDRPETLDMLDVDSARRVCELLVDVLLELHALDPDEVGLGGFGRPEGFLARQLARWKKQWDASVTGPREGVDALLERLTDQLPPQSSPGIVHGDYRLTNVMLAPSLDRIAAVVDWEMSTVGDPLVDVGLLVVYQVLAERGVFGQTPLTPEAGFLPPDALVARYAAGSDRDLSALAWYVAFGWFKLAVIAEGIHARYLQGKTVGEGGFDQMGPWVQRLLDESARALDARP